MKTVWVGAIPYPRPPVCLPPPPPHKQLGRTYPHATSSIYVRKYISKSIQAKYSRIFSLRLVTWMRKKKCISSADERQHLWLWREIEGSWPSHTWGEAHQADMQNCYRKRHGEQWDLVYISDNYCTGRATRSAVQTLTIWGLKHAGLRPGETYFSASCWHLEQYTCHPDCDRESVQKWF